MKLVCSLLLLLCAANGQDYEFSRDFKFGVATSAYQVEGGWDADGKGQSIWDWITHTNPDYIQDCSNGDDACRSYYKTEEDVQLLKNLGVSYYRFSISWSRILPTGHSYHVNQEGVNYYNNLIDELLANGINPIVTMFHWDLPADMHQLGGWPNPLLAGYFVHYAKTLFELFGDRVKYWITFNEPFQFCQRGYSTGELAPAYYQDGHGGYLCARTVLLAHANTFKLYNDDYRRTQYGQIGITLDSSWFEPETDSDTDIEAAETSIQMMLGWFAHPIFSDEGDYPQVMKKRIAAESERENYKKSRLPSFTEDEIELIRGSADFFGLNHYTSTICTSAPDDTYPTTSYNKDVGSYCFQPSDWEDTASSWLKVTPWGFRKLLNWIRREYGNPPILITGNGFSDDTGEINDCRRVNYHNAYLEELLAAIHEDRCNVVAYTAWSFIDNFEWTQGYREKFGLHYVDFDDPERTRVAKMSSKVYKNIIETRKIDWNFIPPGHSCSDAYTFPEDFKFGVATAAYQVEGAWNTAGKGENIWDHLTHNRPDVIADSSNGDIACDTYHKTQEDVNLLKNLGVDFYRFSISWSRLLPYGYSNYTNPDGIRYYNELLAALEANDIAPMVTIFHWDLPQPLQDLGGWTNLNIADHFVNYAEIVFELFGDRVKDWITFNEPYQICAEGYSEGTKAPAYTQDGIGGYLCGYTVLVAHAKTYRLYEQRFKQVQQGRVGITVHGMWAEPETDSEADQRAADTHIQMHFGWFLHPIFSGGYPDIMTERINLLSTQQGFARSRLPAITSTELYNLIRGSADFLGLNHYTSTTCRATASAATTPSHLSDRGDYCYTPPDWEQAASPWLKVAPWGFRKLLKWIRNEYNNPEIVITENGYSDTGGLNDCRRIEYYNSYLENLLLSMYEDGTHVTGYTAWSFMDNFEWMSGYTERFGLYQVNFNVPARTRTPKMSSYAFANVIESRQVDWDYTPNGFTPCQWTNRIKQ